MSIHVRTSIAVLIALSSALLATQYASAQSPSDPVEQATLRELAIQADYSRRDYRAHCLTRWRLHMRILDPLLVATLALDREDTGFFWWPWCEEGTESYSLPDYEPVVTIQITPNWNDRIGRSLTSFTRMELLRDDILLQPISTRRVWAGQVNVIFSGRDAYDGLIKYSPEAFAPGAEVVLRIWRTDNEQPNTMRLSETLLNSISRNFELYYEAMSSE